ncbi:MAG: hypothetical protein GY835_25780 [bacterium]|nr:hypothetical protein [bacterium]
MSTLTRIKPPFGFSYLESLISLAMLAIIVVALCPSVTQQIQHSRQASTARELENIQSALLAYYSDIGDFPAEEIGLIALIRNPGEDGWDGPYLDAGIRDPEHAVTTDGFGTTYIYDLTPSTNPHDIADLIVISCGADEQLDLDTDGIWMLARIPHVDDMAITVSEALHHRAQAYRNRLQLQVMARAAADSGEKDHLIETDVSQKLSRRDNQRRNSALRNLYLSRLEQAGMSPVGLIDKQDQDTNSLPRKRETIRSGLRGKRIRLDIDPIARTRISLAFMQRLIDIDPDLPLTNDWAGDNGMYERLGLGTEFAVDAWANNYHLNMITRQIFSAGPDGNEWTIRDNIPEGSGYW